MRFTLLQALPIPWCAVLFFVACSGSSNANGGFTDPGSGSSSSGSSGSPPPFPISGDGGSKADSSASNECPESATAVYVTGVGNKLYSFYPPTQKFTLVGTFDCLDNPTHMTIDRLGNAWVVANGQLYKASTADAKCAAINNWSFNINYSDFSLSFVGNQNTDTTLYLLNNASKLSAFDTASGTLKTIGNVAVSNTIGDMTSNGDGSLYFLQDVSTPKLYKFDTTNGMTQSSATLAATGGGSQALAFWGGRFYAFENDAIYEYDPGPKTTKPLGTSPLQVTGAGQSTCVPKVPPIPK
jgi:hypothetical protein